MARKITHVVIHTSATEVTHHGKPVSPRQAADTTIEAVRKYHQNVKGWDDVGYHWGVRMTGLIEKGRSEDRMGAGVLGFNANTVHVCFFGHGDLQPFTEEQMKFGIPLVRNILSRHGLQELFLKNPMRVLGHRECNIFKFVPRVFKTCPGTKVSMKDFRTALTKYTADHIGDSVYTEDFWDMYGGDN